MDDLDITEEMNGLADIIEVKLADKSFPVIENGWWAAIELAEFGRTKALADLLARGDAEIPPDVRKWLAEMISLSTVSPAEGK